MKKIFYIFVFFIIAFGVFYVFSSIDPKKELTFNEINKIIENKISKNNYKELLYNLKKVDFNKIDIDKQVDFLKYLETENLFNDDNLKIIIEKSNNIKGIAKDLYNKILYNNYLKNPNEFLKAISSLKIDEQYEIFKTFASKYIEKPKLITDLQNEIKNNKLNPIEKINALKIIEKLK